MGDDAAALATLAPTGLESAGGWDGERAFCFFSIAAISAIIRWISASFVWSVSEGEGVGAAKTAGATGESLVGRACLRGARKTLSVWTLMTGLVDEEAEGPAVGLLSSSSSSSSSSEMSMMYRR